LILVAGGSGFVGSAVVKSLRRDGADVVVMTAHPARSRRKIEKLGARMVEGDVTVPASLEAAVRGSDVVVQVLTFPTWPVEKPGRGFTFEEFDRRGTERLVAAAASAGVRRYVYCSGVGVDPDSPKTWYRAKWFGEEAVRGAVMSHAIIRPSWVYGPKDIALNKFVAFHRWLPLVPVVGDGSQRLQPVFVEDVGEALARAASPDGPSGTFEIGGPEVMTMNQVLHTMMDVRGNRKPLVHLPLWMPKLAAFFLQVLPSPPLSPGALDLATADAVADTGPLLEAFELELTPLRAGLETYLARR
jgi:NADH dehydrogenase